MLMRRLVSRFVTNPTRAHFLAEVIYRLRTLLCGAVRSEELERLLQQELFQYDQRSLWQQLTRHAYRRELVAYAHAMDAWLTREMDDALVRSGVVESYVDEFRHFAAQQTYQPGGMINTNLLLLYSLIRHAQPEVFIESGTMNLYSSVYIAEALRRNSNGAQLYCLSLRA